jgi:hypothetical protein
MITPMINLLKLCVGADSVEDLLDWQTSQRRHWPEGKAVHVTRMWPKREADILEGGSLYWVIKGVILARQRITDLQQVTLGDGIPRCALILDQEVIRTEAAPRRPFQGWRYLTPRTARATCRRRAPRMTRCPPPWPRRWPKSACVDQ